jgi:hypothetical protein
LEESEKNDFSPDSHQPYGGWRTRRERELFGAGLNIGYSKRIIDLDKDELAIQLFQF